MVHPLIPRLILDNLARHQTAGTLDAVTLFVDISGFTPLTAALMAHGTVGAEVLAAVLEAVFDPLIETVYRRGGIIAGFAGDAFKAVFPLAAPHAMTQTLHAAWEIRHWLTAQPIQSTRFGDFAFSGKVGVALGRVDWHIWQESDGAAAGAGQAAAYVMHGPGIAAAMALDPVATRGDVVITTTVLDNLPAGAIAATQIQAAPQEDAWRIDALQLPDPHTPVESSPTAVTQEAITDLEAAARFYPRHLLEATTRGEFRRVTTMFVTSAQADRPADQRAFQAALFTLLHQYQGFLGRVGQIGDKDNGNTLLLFWGAPTGSERDVARALGFIHDLQAASPVDLRAGITTHLAYAGFVGSPRREEYTCYGNYVNLAARLALAADWQEIWLDEATRTGATGFQIEDQGSHLFKGFAQPQAVYRLSGRATATRRAFYQGTLVARRRELAVLTDATQPIFDGRAGGVLMVSGEAGMGKSRLVHEFLQGTLNQGDHASAAVFLLQTDEILRRPLNPFRYWLRHYFDQISAESDAQHKARFEEKLLELIAATSDPALADELMRTRSFLGALIDLRWEDSLYEKLEPQLRHENTLSALKALIKAQSLCQPVILQLEDAHWLDSASVEFLAMLLRNVTSFPFMIIATIRAGDMEDGELAALFETPLPVTTVELGPLDHAGVRQVAEGTLEGPIAESLAAELARRADGNPFFAEQIALYLREQNLLTHQPGGWKLVTDLDSSMEAAAVVLSGDVRAILTARLDRLAPHVKELVQTASVLGREFDTRVVAVMTGQEATLAGALRQAERAGIWTPVEESRYLFHHALLRDAAYDMQLRTRLRRLHLNAVKAITTVFVDELAPRYADLVYHSNRGEATEQERGYARLAGDYAAGQFANDDAVRFLSRALALTPPDAEIDQLQLLKTRAEVHNTTGQRAAQLDDLTQVIQLAHQLEEPALLADAYLQRAHYARVVSDYDVGEEYADLAVDLAGQAHATRLLAKSLNCWGQIRWRRGDYGQARTFLETALAYAEIEAAVEETAIAKAAMADVAEINYQMGLVDYYEANYAAAMAQFQLARAQYEELGMPKGSALCLSMIGAIHYQTGDYTQSQSDYEESLTICHSLGWRLTATFLVGLLGTNLLDLGDFDTAERYHQQARQACRELADREGEAISDDALGLLAAFQGDPPTALAFYDSAIATQRAIDDRRSLAYSLTHAGHAHLALAQLAQAQDAFSEAIAIRRELGEDATRMDSLAGLARTHLQAGNLPAAVTLAGEVADWVEQHDVTGIEYPVHVYLTMWEIFTQAASAHPQEATQLQRRAADMLHRGHALLQERSARIRDEARRAAFLTNIPFNAALQQQWENAHPPVSP